MKKFRVGIDVDDVLYECISYAIDLANIHKKFSPPPFCRGSEKVGER